MLITFKDKGRIIDRGDIRKNIIKRIRSSLYSSPEDIAIVKINQQYT